MGKRLHLRLIWSSALVSVPGAKTGFTPPPDFARSGLDKCLGCPPIHPRLLQLRQWFAEEFSGQNGSEAERLPSAE